MANQDHLAILKKGVSAWNEWMGSNPDIIPDLRETDLSGLYLSEIDLSKADLSHADIQGTNFTKAILKGANFSHSEAGTKTALEVIALAQVPVLFSLFSGFLSISLSWSLASYFIPNIQTEGRIFGGFLFIAYVIFFLVTKSKNLNPVVVLLTGIISVSMFVNLLNISGLDIIGITAFFDSLQIVAGIIAGGVFLTVTFTLGSYFSSSPFPYIFIGNSMLLFASFFDVAQKSSLYEKSIIEYDVEIYLQRIFITVILSFFLAFVYRSIARRLLEGNNEFSKLLRNVGAIFRTSRGTSFRDADLTDANFYAADLKSIDFRGAILTRVCWTDAKNLLGSEIIQNQKILIEFVRTEGTILADSDVREVLITANGKGKKLCGKNLKGAYLVNVDLSESDLSEADLSEANLEDSNLEGANLTKTQALGTNFRGAKFTGVSGLKSWNRNDNTVLDDIDCTYVYLNTPEEGRYPDNRNLETGEFTKLFQEVKNTIELIFRDGIDWKAFAYAFDETNAQIYDASGQRLSLRKYEVLDDGLIRLEVLVPPDIDLEKTRADLEFKYGHQIARLEGRVESLQNINDKLLNTLKPGVHFHRPVEKVQVGDSNTVTEETYNVGQSGATGRYARSDNNTFIQSEQKQTLAEAAAEIQRLLKQLEQTNPNVTEAEKVAYVNDETTPSFKRRVVGALQAGSEAAIGEFLDNPYVNVGKAVVKGWIKPE